MWGRLGVAGGRGLGIGFRSGRIAGGGAFGLRGFCFQLGIARLVLGLDERAANAVAHTLDAGLVNRLMFDIGNMACAMINSHRCFGNSSAAAEIIRWSEVRGR